MSTTAQNAPRTRTGCQNCRLRHLRCDELRPSCARCTKAGIECVRGYNIRFRHGANPSIAKPAAGPAKPEYDFSKEQPWVKTSQNLTFLDETRELMNFYDHEASGESAESTDIAEVPWKGANTTASQTQPEREAHNDDLPVTPPALDRMNTTEHLSLDDIASPSKRRRLAFNQSYQTSPTTASPIENMHSPAKSWHASPHTGWTPSATDSLVDALNFDPALVALETTTSNNGLMSPHHSNAGFTAVSESLSRIYLETPIWPLSDKGQAVLLRYFVENIARNFDLSDPYRHFRTVVPQRAGTCPTLLNAILALSARHLSRVGEFDPLVSNRYQQECLKHLIPMLDDSSAILDENLLASTIILRHIEEIEVPLSGQSPSDQTSHLLGANALISAQERAINAGGLRQAAFWVGLRQEIYVAFVNQRSVMPMLEQSNMDRSFETAPDHIWGCRMVTLCADVIRFCFGNDDQTATMYNWLADSVMQWYNCKPDSFAPLFFQEADDGSVFPDIWFLHDEIVIGWEHYHIAKILLSAHNPKIPRLGPSRAAALRVMDDEIKEHVKVLCGIAVSNPDCPPNFTYASMAVTMAGDRFTERHEQEALLGILTICESQYAYPTGHARENLRAAWGWERSM